MSDSIAELVRQKNELIAERDALQAKLEQAQRDIGDAAFAGHLMGVESMRDKADKLAGIPLEIVNRHVAEERERILKLLWNGPFQIIMRAPSTLDDPYPDEDDYEDLDTEVKFGRLRDYFKRN